MGDCFWTPCTFTDRALLQDILIKSMTMAPPQDSIGFDVVSQIAKNGHLGEFNFESPKYVYLTYTVSSLSQGINFANYPQQAFRFGYTIDYPI